MARWTGSWLPGSPDQGGGVAGSSADGSGPMGVGRYPGEQLGLPAEGPGSVAGIGRRAVAFLLDLLVSGLLAGMFTAPDLPRNWSLLAWALLTVIPTAVFGMTPGMTLLGLRVARLGGATFVGIPRAVLRTLLLFFVVPAVVTNADNRGLHDRAAGTVVVRTR